MWLHIVLLNDQEIARPFHFTDTVEFLAALLKSSVDSVSQIEIEDRQAVHSSNCLGSAEPPLQFSGYQPEIGEGNRCHAGNLVSNSF